jgi:hypothetical protein
VTDTKNLEGPKLLIRTLSVSPKTSDKDYRSRCGASGYFMGCAA